MNEELWSLKYNYPTLSCMLKNCQEISQTDAWYIWYKYNPSYQPHLMWNSGLSRS